MDPTSSSSSSSMSRMNNYDVFLSFRGFDTRSNIISHLYHALRQKGIHTFKDSEELELGDRRSELFHAIVGSSVAIVTFSENYALSKWCLDELQKIMELKEEGKLTVIPIFYHVSPGEVRLHSKDSGEKGCYQKAMDEMETKYGNDPETVKRWRNALWQGVDLIGIPVGQRQDEADVVRDVVGKVFKILNRHMLLEVAKYPVGIHRHLEAIRHLLHIDPHVNDVCMVGLLGQGGAGKTTLSKAICNDIADSFDSWCFLQDVRETTSKMGLAHLQQTLLRRLLSEDGLTVSSVDEGKQLIKERLRYKKVLLILDDVDELNQLDALAGNLDWFGNGSRIIITTRNNHVLTSVHVNNVYRVELLNQEEAIDLFQLHAFGEKQEEVNVDRGLIDSFVEYADKLPLALVVLGAFLRGRSATEWKGKLKELKESADETINSALKISFDGLKERHKEIFLDVACFFKGWKVDDVEKILDSCGFVTSFGINTLIERCLVTIFDGEIQMHDLLGAMGQSIAHDKCSKGNRILSRIWRYEDFQDVLLGDRERQQAVKGIVLQFSEGEKFAPIESNDFKGFKNLRILIVENVYVGPRKSLQLPRELRWLKWWGYSAHTIEFDPYSKLVGLDLANNVIRQIKQGTGFEELKYVNLSFCISLVALPDFSKSLKLEYLELKNCYSLTTLDEAIGDLENLVLLEIEFCYELEKIPSSLRSKHFRTLSFRSCCELYKLPAMKEELTFLENLDLSHTSVEELPDSIGNCVALKELNLSYCQELTTIPSSVYKLRSLEKLCMSQCRKLLRFPRRPAGGATDIFGFPNLELLEMDNCKLKDVEFLNDLTCFQTLWSLELSGNEFDHIPTCISKFHNLQEMKLHHCKKLLEISELHTFICQSPQRYEVDLFNCIGLNQGYIHRSLSLEKVRGFVGSADVLLPGEEFPHWVNVRSMEPLWRYRVCVPGNISEDDILGLALFVCFNYGTPPSVAFKVGGSPHETFWKHAMNGGVHTLFVYMTVLDWRNLTLDFTRSVRRWGMRLLCKQEEDDHLVQVQGLKEEGWINIKQG